MRPLLTLMFAAFAAIAAVPADAQMRDVPQAIQSVRESVLAVGTFQRTRSPAFKFLGTGFVVGDGTLVATNAHVVPPTLNQDQLEVIAVLLPEPGQGERVREAVRVAVDPEHDLALLRLAGAPLPALKLSEAGLGREGEWLLFTGYPIGNVLGAYPVTHRAMISAVVPIALPSASASQLDPKVIRRISSGPFPVLQLDGTAYPGNSGSPVYSPETREVVGVVNMVLVRGTRESALSQPSGITYAIPVEHLRRLMATVPQRP